MKRIGQVGFIVLLALGSVGGFAQTEAGHFKKTTVCTVLKQRLKSAGISVIIRAGVLADGMHGIILIDGNCPDQGLPLDFPQPNADQTVSEFEKLISGNGTPGTAGRQVSGTFFGKLRLDPSDRKLYYALLSVRDVQVSPSAAVFPEEAGQPGRRLQISFSQSLTKLATSIEWIVRRRGAI